MAEDAVGVRLMDPTPEQEQELKAILTAAQERQKEAVPARKRRK
jgi:hypothetical protein